MVPMARPLLLLLLTLPLAAAGPDLDLQSSLGSDPATQIVLVPPGIWDGLFLAQGTTRPPRAKAHGIPEATVEVNDFDLHLPTREVSFARYLKDLRQRLRRGFRVPPPSQGQIELAELMGSDPAHPEASSLDRVRSLQLRYNQLPPSASPLAGH